MDMSQTSRRRPRPTLVLFDPLSAPSPTKPASTTGLGPLAEQDDDDDDNDFDDNESFFSALGGAEGFPIEGGSLVGELVATSPERPAPCTVAIGESDRPVADLMTWESPVKPSMPTKSPAVDAAVTRVAIQVPLPASPPPGSPSSFDFLAPTPRPASRLMATSASLATIVDAQRVPLPESPPRRQNVMDWLAETPMPTRRVANPSAVNRSGPSSSDTSSPGLQRCLADNTAATLALPELDESYEDLLQTPAPRKPQAFVASANVTAFVSPTASTASPSSRGASFGPLPELRSGPAQTLSPPERTTLLPAAPRWLSDEADDDLMRTPAPKKVLDSAFARSAEVDELTLSLLPPTASSSTSCGRAPTNVTSLPANASVFETTTLLPTAPELADESCADLLSTPMPKSVRAFAHAADSSAFPVETSFSSDTSSILTVGAIPDGQNEAEQTTFLPVMDASYDDLMATPALQRVKAFLIADASVSLSPPACSAIGSAFVIDGTGGPSELQNRTTILPSFPADREESFEDLMATPAPRRVQQLDPDISTFPSPPMRSGLGTSASSTASSTSTSPSDATATDGASQDELDQTGFWPVVAGVDETFDDLMTTPAPRRIKMLSASPPSAPALMVSPRATELPKDSASLEARFGYLLASTRGVPRTPVTVSGAPTAIDMSFANDDESFDLDALKCDGMGDETFDLLSTPLPSLAQSRTSNFPRSPTVSPTPAVPPTPVPATTADTEDDGDETLILSAPAFDLHDESFSLLSGSRPSGLEDDDESDDWGLEEERALQPVMSAKSRVPAPPPALTAVVQTQTSGSLIHSASNLRTLAATPRRALQAPIPTATYSSSNSALRQLSSANSRLAPRASLAMDAPSMSASASSTHQGTPSLTVKSNSEKHASKQTPCSQRRTSSIGSAASRDLPRAAQPSPAKNTGQRRLSGIPGPSAGAPPSDITRAAHATPLADRSARPVIARPPVGASTVNATPTRAQHRRTSSVPVAATPAARSASAARLTAAFATARTPVAPGRTPLAGLDPTVNAPEPAGILKIAPSPTKTVSQRGGTRSLSHSTSRPDESNPLSTSNSSLLALSERVSSSRLHSRSLHTLPGSASAAAPAGGATASRLPRQASQAASGIRAPTASAGSKPTGGSAPTLESVRAALASLEARRRK